MGYDLHITREPDDLDDSSDESYYIGLAEWLSFVEADPELRLVGVAEANSPTGSTIRYTNDGLAVWLRPSGDRSDDAGPWFDLRQGRVIVANPDDETIAKMCAIATALGARVRGEEGETYPPGDDD